MKVLYAGDLSPEGTCRHRMLALRRIGLEVHGFDFHPCLSAGGPILRRLRRRLFLGPQVDRLNAGLLAAADAVRPDLIWFDKPIFVRAATLEALRSRGIVLVNYVCDNPFGTWAETGWKLVRRTIPLFDLMVVPRPSSLDDYRGRGARRVVMMPFAFDPIVNVPSSPGSVVKSVPLSFIGTPYDDRPRQLRELAGRGVPVSIRGPLWRRHLPFRYANLTIGPPVWGDAYREAIWRSEVCLSFVSHCSCDPYSHKAFEITACGTFLLAEGTEAHRGLWDGGHEAEFFGSMEEAADKARFYLRSEPAREAIARAGCRRTWNAGYSNDERLAAVFAEIDGRLGARLTATASDFMARRREQLGIETLALPHRAAAMTGAGSAR